LQPSDTFANDSNLRILQRPWANATTQDLLVRMIQDADLAGNCYIWNTGEQLVRDRDCYRCFADSAWTDNAHEALPHELLRYGSNDFISANYRC